ncbi:hypothetical protein PFISCL1PPCAC_11287, partial [Pristionchus fissidentatus]
QLSPLLLFLSLFSRLRSECDVDIYEPGQTGTPRCIDPSMPLCMFKCIEHFTSDDSPRVNCTFNGCKQRETGETENVCGATPCHGLEEDCHSAISCVCTGKECTAKQTAMYVLAR